MFVSAYDFGLTATENPDEIDGNTDILDELEEIRASICSELGFVDDPADASVKSPGFPNLVWVTKASDYDTADDTTIEADEADRVARYRSMGKLHPAVAITGIACTSAAAHPLEPSSPT